MPKQLVKYLTPQSLLIAVGTISVIVVVVAYVLASHKPAALYVQAQNAPITEEVDTTGTVKAADSLELSFDISGRIASIPAVVGQHVAAGQALATLSGADLSANVAQAQAALAMQQAKLDGLKAGATPQDLAVSQTAITNAQSGVNQAKQSLLSTAEDAYVKADDAIHNKVDLIFSRSPETWAPIAGALALQAGHMDHRISDWASTKNPVFGSQKNAANWSDYLEYSTGAVYFVTVMITPSGADTSDWLKAKENGLLIGLAAGGLTEGITSAGKDLSKRQRPDESDNTSFPSGHASGSSAMATLARRNLDSVPMSDGTRFFADAGITALAVGTGWARVEANKHYPADVLVGYSLGHFISAFVNDAFLGLNDEKAPRVSIEPAKKSIFVGLSWKY